jgi:hypothetical protein
MAHCGTDLAWKIAVVHLVVKLCAPSLCFAFHVWENKDWKIRVAFRNGNHGDLTGRPACTRTVCMTLGQEVSTFQRALY